MKILLVGGRSFGKLAILASLCGNHGLTDAIMHGVIDASERPKNVFNEDYLKNYLGSDNSRKQSFEPEPSKFISKPKNNFKTR